MSTGRGDGDRQNFSVRDLLCRKDVALLFCVVKYLLSRALLSPSRDYACTAVRGYMPAAQAREATFQKTLSGNLGGLQRILSGYY